jgi:peptide/nickel transport system substrate-binding protein
MGSGDEFAGFEGLDESTRLSRQALLKLGLAVPLGAAVLANPRFLEAAWAATPAKKPKTLVIADTVAAENLDPGALNAAFLGNVTAVANLYTPWLRLGTKPNLKSLGGGLLINPNKIFAELASYKRNADGKTLTFRIKPGIMSDFGNELTTADAKWAYDRALAQRRIIFSGLRNVAQVIDFNVIDKYTFSYVTLGRNQITPIQLTSRNQSPFDSTEAKKHATAADPWAESWLGQNAAGFGPYRVSSWTPGQQITFTAREQYKGSGPKPAFKSVQILAIPVIGDRIAAVEAGDVHVALGITPLAAGRANAKRNRAKEKVVQFQGNGQIWLVPNSKQPEFTPAVRKAMALAVPYEAIIKSVYNGKGTIAKSMFYSYIPCRQTKYWDYATNLAKAKQLMAGKSIGPIDFLYPESRPLMAPVATILQQAFKQIGITTNLVPTPDSVAQTRVNVQRNIPLYVTDTFFSATPMPQMITPFFVAGSAFNVGNWVDDGSYAKIHATATDSFDQKVVCQAADEFQKKFQEDLPVIPLIGFNHLYIMNPQVQTYLWNPDGAPRLQFATWQ